MFFFYQLSGTLANAVEVATERQQHMADQLDEIIKNQKEMIAQNAAENQRRDRIESQQTEILNKIATFLATHK